MGYRLYPILITLAIILIGHVLKWISIINYKKRRDETIVFSNKFVELANYYTTNFAIEPNLYAACIHDVDNIQEELGYDGVLADFVDPLKNIKGRNYQLFMNVLPEMRSMVNQLDSNIIRERVGQLLNLCDDALGRHIGNLDRAISKEKSRLLNPFSCFSSGIRWLVGLPFDILCWCGLLSPNRNAVVHGNGFFKVVGNIIILIGLLSSIMTIALGWDGFLALIQSMFPNLA